MDIIGKYDMFLTEQFLFIIIYLHLLMNEYAVNL